MSGPLRPTISAAREGKRCLYASMTRAGAFEAAKAVMEHSTANNLGAELLTSTNRVMFPGGGFIQFSPIIDKDDELKLAGMEFDLANDYALEWPGVAARVGRT